MNENLNTEGLIAALIDFPERLHEAAAARDEARAHFCRVTARLAALSLTMNVFRDREGKPWPAANEKERDIAVQYVLGRSTIVGRARRAREQAERDYDRWEARNSNYRLIVRLVIAERQKIEEY